MKLADLSLLLFRDLSKALLQSNIFDQVSVVVSMRDRKLKGSDLFLRFVELLVERMSFKYFV